MTEGWDGWPHDAMFGPDEPHDGLVDDPLAHDVGGADGVGGAAQRYGLDWQDGSADEPGPGGHPWADAPPVHPDPTGGHALPAAHHPVGDQHNDQHNQGGNVAEPAPGAMAQADGMDAAADADLSPFPARLELDVVPSDGLDWVDARLLGAGDGADVAPPAVHLDPPEILLADLHRMDGADGSPSWAALTDSDDPVVRALARFWRR